MNLKKTIKIVANDPGVQKTCLHAMFYECERGSELWEILECNSKKYSAEVQYLIFGPDKDEEEDNYVECLSNYYHHKVNPKKVIDLLLKEVEKNIVKRINMGRLLPH